MSDSLRLPAVSPSAPLSHSRSSASNVHPHHSAFAAAQGSSSYFPNSVGVSREDMGSPRYTNSGYGTNPLAPPPPPGLGSSSSASGAPAYGSLDPQLQGGHYPPHIPRAPTPGSLGGGHELGQLRPASPLHGSALNAVMQLAEAARQQQGGGDMSGDFNADGTAMTPGKKQRKRGGSSVKNPRGGKAARGGEEGDDNGLEGDDDGQQYDLGADHEGWMSQGGDQMSPISGGNEGETSATTGGRGGSTRQLSTSKRAAQNRAAQRAFRERRDKYVKELEQKAAQLNSALLAAEESRKRYAEALQTIEGLRQDNHSLRVALAAVGGGAALPSSSQVSQANGAGPSTGASTGTQGWGMSAPAPHLHRSQSSDRSTFNDSAHQHGGAYSHTYGYGHEQDDRRGSQNPNLDSLSAVAAAAAAAAVAGDAQANSDRRSPPRNAAPAEGSREGEAQPEEQR